MNKIKKLISLTACTLACVATTLLGVTTQSSTKMVNADTGANRYFHAENATVSTEWVDSTAYHTFKGLRTTLTIEEGASYATATYNAVVTPSQKLTISSPAVKNAEGTKVTAGSIVALTYTAVSDQSKKVTIASGVYSNEGRVTVTFTDDLRLGSTPLVVDNVKGKYAVSNYASSGESYGEYAFKSSFLNYGGGAQIALTAEGKLKYDDKLLADLKNSEFYSKMNYTAEYVDSVVTEVAKGAILSVKVFAPTTNSYTFDIGGLNGQDGWKGGSSPWTDVPKTDGYAVQKTNEIYQNRNCRIGDLVEWYTTYREDGVDTSFMNGFAGASAWANGGQWFQVGNATIKDDVFLANGNSYKVGSSYPVIVNVLSGGESGLNGKMYQVFNFEVAASYTVKFTANSQTVSTKYGVIDGDELTMPAAQAKDGYAFVGWTDGTGLYAANTKATITGAVNFTAVYLDFICEGGASARLTAPYGIRFTSKFDTATMETIVGYEGVSYTFGAKIITDNSTASVDIAGDSEKLYAKENYSCFNSALVGIKAENYARVFHARPYITFVDSNGATITINAVHEEKNGAIDDGRSYAQIITAAYEDKASYASDVQTTIENIYNTVMNSETLLPFVSVVKNVAGVETSCTADFVEELTAYFEANQAKIGDTISVETAITVPTGYVIDVENSVLSGVMTTRGLVLKIVLIEEGV